MTTALAWPFVYDSTFASELGELAVPWAPAPVSDPRLLVLNEALALELGLDPDFLRSPEGVAVLAGNAVPEGSTPVAQAYAGHQFGGYSPRLGDGRALLLGEVVDGQGRRRDVALKGSGRTPFARGGDGRAAVGPMLREMLIGEAMHALGIPTTRALAVVATGEQVARETLLPGAVLTRVAASHLRVGTFQYAAASGDTALVARLIDHAARRHHPEVVDSPVPALGLLEAVVAAQASLVAQWMLVGFVHGVMNTDNTTISGETIDYGPCAFIDAYDPAAVFSSIDHGGRYAFGNQPAVMAWNLARLAETLLPLIDDDIDTAVEAATGVLRGFGDRLGAVHEPGMRAKLGLDTGAERPGDPELAGDLLGLMHREGTDFTGTFRDLAQAARGDTEQIRARLAGVAEIDSWLARWRERIGPDGEAVASAMDTVNPQYIPRNHLVEEALTAATAGDLGPVEELLRVVSDPFVARPGRERFALPAPAGSGRYVTYCGT